MNKPLIINSPDLQTLRQKYAYAVLTFLFWVIWFYLWLPLISLLAWLFGVEIFYQHMVVLEGLAGLRDLLGWYALVIVLIGITLLCWSAYNLLRFRGKNKRIRVDTLPLQQMADDFGVDPQAIESCRHGRRIVISHDNHGNISHIDCQATDRR